MGLADRGGATYMVRMTSERYWSARRTHFNGEEAPPRATGCVP
jgi:hypothetical protein